MAGVLAVLILAALPYASTTISPSSPTVSESVAASIASSHTQVVWAPYVGLVASIPPVRGWYAAGEGLQILVNRSGTVTTYAWNRTPSGSAGVVMPSATPQTVTVGWYPTTTAGGTTVVTTAPPSASAGTAGSASQTASSNAGLNVPPASGDMYGGDEFYYTTKQASGLLAMVNVRSPVISMSTPLGSACLQIGFKTGGVAGVLLNAYGAEGVGVIVNTVNDSLEVVKGRWASSNVTIDDVLRETRIRSVPDPTVYVKLDVSGSDVVALVDVVDSKNASVSYWYEVSFKQLNTYVSNIVVVGSPQGRLIIMKGDYLRVTFDESQKVTVYINGTDMLGRHVRVSFGGQDGVAVLKNPFVLWPLNGVIAVKLGVAPLKYNIVLTGTISTYVVGASASYATVSVNTSGFASVNIPFIRDFADYRDLIAVFIVLLIVLLAAEANAPVAGFVAVGAMILFSVVGWLHIGGAVIGMAVVIVGLGATISRKGNS